MTTFSHAGSRRLYSWWWDSHISPKNSKWLQENLTDMDFKVKAMIKLIEEDADSFARRAEMYYRKRPELMTLVEEFYRAYRALAERYDHATGALRQAQRTMTEAFPDQIPFILSDESPSGRYATEAEPHTPEMLRPARALFDSDDSHKDGFEMSSRSHAIKRNGAFSEEKFAEGRVRKGLNFQEEERIGSEYKVTQEVSQLSKENQNLKSQISSELVCADKAEAEVQSLKDTLSKLNSEKEDVFLQYQLSQERISSLETEISRTQEDFKKLSDEMLIEVTKLKRAEEQCLLLEKENQSLQLELDTCKQREKKEQEELDVKLQELEKLNISIQELKERCKKHEDEKKLLSENLKHMEKTTEKNFVLEVSLSDANVELEGLREKIETLEESCESLHGMISIHISEKSVLVTQVEAIAQNMEKLSEKNTLLENSLFDVNVEVEGLRGKLKVLEESCQSLNDQKSNLLVEKSTLVAEVGSISHSLENMESRYVELEGKNSSLEREKEQTLDQVTELQDYLKLEKEEHETLMQANKSRLATLENQIHLLHEEGRRREEEFEVEQHKIMNAQFEIFILQQCLGEIKEKNVILSDECQKNLEASRYAEKLILELEHKSSIQEKTLTSLSERNEKLVEGLHLMMKVLNIHEDCGSPGGIKDCLLFLQLILREIRGLQISLSDAQDDSQHLILEKSVILTLLGQLGLDVADLKSEKNVLEQESKKRSKELSMLQNEKHGLLENNEQLRWNVKACNQREEVLKAEMEILCRQLSDLREAHCTLESEVYRLLEENQSLSKKCYDLRESEETLEEENHAILVEVMTLECLYLIFKSSDAERALELQLLSNDLGCLHGIRNDLDQEIKLMNEKMGALEVENMHLKESVVNLEESRRRCVFLEDDLNTARNVSEQLNRQIETLKILLVEKDVLLSEANQKIQATQDKNEELCRSLEALMLDIDGLKAAREDLEEKIITLSEGNAHRDNEISCLHQANEILNMEHDKLNEEIEELRNREKHLISELKEGTVVVKSCEVEIAALLHDIQISTIIAAVFEEKILELLLTCESLEISAMVQREMLHEDIKRKNVYEDELKKKLDALEGENRGLKEELNAFLPLVMSLSDGVASLEEHTLSLGKHHISDNQEKQDNSVVSFQQNKSNQEQSEDHNATVSAGILKLQKLHTKVNVLEKVVMDNRSLLEQERFISNTNLATATREIKGLESKGSTSQEEAQIIKDIDLELENSEKPITDHNLQEGDAEISKVKSEQMMKDIQLDHVLSSLQHGNGISSHAVSTIESAETDDQLLELWETVSRDCSKMQKASSLTSKHDLEYHQIEAVEEQKSECPSGLVVEKELGIDKLELPKKVNESHRKWNKSVIERLSSDAQRLLVLQTSVQELKRDIETSEMSYHPTNLEFDTVKAQLKEAEGAILQLIDINGKLTKKSEDVSTSSDSLVGERNEIGNTSEKQISEQAPRGSENIARLELELQKIQYILLKRKEEYENKRTKAVGRRTGVLLRDYLYGRSESPRQKKVSFCACMRPKTKGD